LTVTAECLAEVRRHLGSAVNLDHLIRSDWRRQTDCLQQTFIAARIFADCGTAAVFVDGHINDYVKYIAVNCPQGVKAFFNRRFHDAGYKGRRLVYFDTRATRKMGRSGSGSARLHFHALIESPRGWTRGDLERVLKKVFGKATPMGQRQFHFPKPDWSKHHSHNEVQITGPLGKLAYVMAHGGTSYVDLKLTGGKRSRSTPVSRGRYNRHSSGLARGIPSNFNAAVVFVDSASKRAGKEAFDAWVKAERAARRPAATTQRALTPKRQEAR
jgi:hypothetical protein